MGRISGERWNKLVESIMERYETRVEYLAEALMEDGYPPFHEPLSEREQYEQLIAMRDSNDPEFWGNPEAVTELAKLSARFGHPPRRTVGPYGQESQHVSTEALRRQGY